MNVPESEKVKISKFDDDDEEGEAKEQVDFFEKIQDLEIAEEPEVS